MPRQVKKQEISWLVRVGPEMDRAVEEAVKMDMHVTKSDLIRDAVRRYLEENFPSLVGRIRGELPGTPVEPEKKEKGKK